MVRWPEAESGSQMDLAGQPRAASPPLTLPPQETDEVLTGGRVDERKALSTVLGTEQRAGTL